MTNSNVVINEDAAIIEALLIEDAMSDYETVLASETALFNDAFSTRIAHEDDACDAAIKNLSKNRSFFTQAAVVDALIHCAVDASFINYQENVKSRFDMKAINRCEVYLQFALTKAFSFKEFTANAFTVFQTACNMHDNELTMTRNDAHASCTSKKDRAITIDKDREKFIERREAIYSATKRQADMSIKSLLALNMLRETARDTYALNADNLLVQLIRARLNEK